MIDLDTLTVQEIRQGYRLAGQPARYACLFCNTSYEDGLIYNLDGQLCTAGRAIARHIADGHESVFEQLLALDKRFIGLTDHQKNMLRLMYLGKNNTQIAAETGTAASTIRAQRFLLKEKSRQAKLMLVLADLLAERQDSPLAAAGSDSSEDLLPVSGTARQVDERFAITDSEREQIIKTYVVSREPLVLKALPVRQKRKLVLLQLIAAQFEAGRRYDEKEINVAIRPIYPDFATIRRYLIEYGFMARTPSGSAYWLRCADRPPQSPG